ncbi:hypothetical protein GCM10010174_30940 [Kutzneria viridogrisea]|uniref:EspG family protein n=1 Tax=Kutzneria viridogrisea TaxID=47990 RepID=A0ABR6BQ78_9PSEU|nr:hypothetical protein [Kutzneria viridogrisea]
MAERRIELSEAELFLLWWAMRLPEPPTPLLVPHIGPTAEDRERLVAQASESLSGRGLGVVRGPADDLLAALTALADPPYSVDLVFSGREGAGRAMVTPEVVAVLVDGRVWLTPISADTVVRAVLEVVPPRQAGEGHAVTLALADYREACQAGAAEGDEAFLHVLRAAGVPAQEAQTLLRALTGRLGGGQASATSRDRFGGLVREPEPLTWLDTARGRYGLRRRGEWVTVLPMDHERLDTMITELIGPVLSS